MKKYMKKYQYKIIIQSIGLIVMQLLFASCNKEDELINTNDIILDKVALSLGGKDYINNINSIRYRVEGSVFENEQSGPLLKGIIHVNNYNCLYTSLLNQRALIIDFDNIDSMYPVPFNTGKAKIVINNKEGSIRGQYHWFSFFLNQTEAKPLYSSRIEALLKNQKMSNPIELLREVTLNKDTISKIKDKSFLISTGVSNHFIELLIDEKTNLPSKARIKENDFLLGDVIFEVEYQNWLTVENTKFPTKLIFTLNGNLIKEEKISQIDLNPNITNKNFIPESKTHLSYNPIEAKYGIISSQWYHRAFSGGLPMDQPLDNGALVLEDFDISIFGFPNQKMGESVKIIGRPDVSIWSVIIRTSTGILVVESPLNQIWTRSVIKAIKIKYPGIPIEGIITTHTHYDHLGGLREIVPEAKNIYVASEGIPYIKKVLSSEHSLAPDAFSKSSKEYFINEVSGITKLDNGEVEIHLLKNADTHETPFIIDNTHANDMLVVYLPKYKTIIEADMLNSGIFLDIWNGKTPNGFTELARSDFSTRCDFLLKYIKEKKLNVDKVIGIHGGVTSIENLKRVAANK
jgi:glyoxylase-like metal-dependent hydrolase (beta-lactamase superfamily II)